MPLASNISSIIANQLGRLRGSIEAQVQTEATNLLSKFANQLPDKLNTVVGESGIKLSGGQRQRIAIARALIKNAPILIMDEATSSLDNLTEKEIQLALDELMKDKTTIIIAHRLSTIQNADVIFTLEKGSIESKGNHEFLLKNSAVYKKLQLQEDANEN